MLDGPLDHEVNVRRMRKRYRQLLHDEIRRTVEEDCDVDDEIRHLFDALKA